MPNSRTYCIFSFGAYNAPPLPQAFIDDHGPFVSGYDDITGDPIELTTTDYFKDAIAIFGITPAYFMADGSRWDGAGDPDFVIVGIPNMTEREERALYEAVDAVPNRTHSVKISMKQIAHFQLTGELPPA